MYIGVALVILGESVIFRSLHLVLYAAAMLTIAHIFVVLYEEPTLRNLVSPTTSTFERYRVGFRNCRNLNSVSVLCPRADAELVTGISAIREVKS